MAYTKGEWLVHEWGSKYTVVEAKVRVTKKPGITMAGQKILAKEITKKADAELMAAAPAMYEALKDALLCVENREQKGNISGINWEQLIFDIKTALALAEEV